MPINLEYPCLDEKYKLELEKLTLSILVRKLVKDSLRGLILYSLGLVRESDYNCSQVTMVIPLLTEAFLPYIVA